MVAVLIIFLVLASVGWILMERQERLHNDRFVRRRTSVGSSHQDYLEKVKESTEKRLEEEKQQQEYKNSVKKNYL